MNPFQIHGTVVPPYFTDRAVELKRIMRTFEEPGAKLVVYGERRQGKTSALRVALGRHTAAGGLACMADFSTASSPSDLANRVLEAALGAFGRSWRDVITELPRRLGVSLKLGNDAVTQLPTVSLDLGVRDASETEQREALGRVLDTIDRMAGERGENIALVLDEFQEVHRFGGELAEWHLRGVIQHHAHVSYVVAGSRPHLIRRMLENGRAFYKLFDILEFGPIEAGHLAQWIDARMESGGSGGRDAGMRIVRLAGPRTRDIVQLARRSFDVAEGGGIDDAVIESAYADIVRDEDASLRVIWGSLTSRQQNVLRAVASGTTSLTSADTIRAFALRSSASVSQTAARFVEDGILEQVAPGEYRLDSPFFRGWIVANALPDLGIHLPVSHLS